MDATPIQHHRVFRDAWESQPNFHYLVNSRYIRISPNNVFYQSKDGAEHKLAAGSVVIAVGMRAKTDDALALYTPGDKVQLMGDCDKLGNVQTLMRSAFSTASQL